MILNENEIIQLIEIGHESDFLDFKRDQYIKPQFDSFIKDIMAMANSFYNGDKYIILGIKDNISGVKDIFGINQELDPSTFQQLILENIEPEIKFQYFSFEYKGKTIGVFKVFNSNNRPFIIKKKRQGLHEGLCVIRKGNQQTVAKRIDFDNFYKLRRSAPKFKLPNSSIRKYKLNEDLISIDGILLRNIGESTAYDIYIHIFLDVWITTQVLIPAGDIPKTGKIALSLLDKAVEEWKFEISQIVNEGYASVISTGFNMLLEYKDENEIKYYQFIEGGISWINQQEIINIEIGSSGSKDDLFTENKFIDFEIEINELLSKWKQLIKQNNDEELKKIDKDAREIAKKMYISGDEGTSYKVHDLFKYCEEAQKIGRAINASREITKILSKNSKLINKDDNTEKLIDFVVAGANAAGRHYFNHPTLENYFWDLFKKVDSLIKYK